MSIKRLATVLIVFIYGRSIRIHFVSITRLYQLSVFPISCFYCIYLPCQNLQPMLDLCCFHHSSLSISVIAVFYSCSLQYFSKIYLHPIGYIHPSLYRPTNRLFSFSCPIKFLVVMPSISKYIIIIII